MSDSHGVIPIQDDPARPDCGWHRKRLERKSLGYPERGLNANEPEERALLQLEGSPTAVSERKQTERLLAVQNGILEQIASGSALPEVLNYLARAIEGA